MAYEKMVRSASDNKYLHRDFHLFMNRGLCYLEENFGDGAVEEYLKRFTVAYYKPLIEKIRTEGLSALEAHYKEIFEVEEAPEALETELTENGLYVHILASPAVTHIYKRGETPAKNYRMVEEIVSRELVRDTGYSAALEDYDDKTGETRLRYTKLA